MRIHFVASDFVGGGNLRSFWPAEALARSGVEVSASLAFPPADEVDVVVIHRPLAEDTLEWVRRYRDAGAVVWVDEDDDLSRVHETENLIGLRKWTPQLQELHDEAVAEADGLITATEPLAEVYGSLAREVRVVRNRLPAWVGRTSHHDSRRQASSVRVGWAGIVQTHGHDLRWIRPVARAMVEGAIFSTVGDPDAVGFLELDRAEAFPFQYAPAQLYQLMARAHVGVVPLAPIEFNRSKSWLKALEYMTLGKPVVVTDLPEQRLLVEHGVNGFLASTPEEFADAVRLLVRDEDLRRRMGQAARERARREALEDHAYRWERALVRAAVAP